MQLSVSSSASPRRPAAVAYELWSKLLKQGYIGGYIRDYYRAY